MEFSEKTISNLIENQFPSIYKETGPNFIAFMQAYYAWMESEGNAIYHSRRLLEYRDIDSTINTFLKHFKNKYLYNIRFDTAVSTQEMVKHSLDLYRSKGTERSLALFFRSVFGVDAEVYYPAKDIFKTSAGVWIKPEYLEISYSDNMKDFEKIQIEGVDSGATAFVSSYFKKLSSINPIYTHLYFITNRVGDFLTGELIRASATKEIGPTIIGSMTTLDILNGGENYVIGDIVQITSNVNGTDGIARVANTEDITGKISFNLVNGGWGYNGNSQLIISNNVITLSNVTVSNAYSGNNLFTQFETIYQPIANVSFNALANGTFSAGDSVYRLDISNTVVNYGTVLSVINAANNTGSLLISVNIDNYIDNQDALTFEDGRTFLTQSGNILETENKPLFGNNFIFNSNTGAYANITLTVDNSVSANVMAISSNLTFSVSNSTVRFANGDSVYQIAPGGAEVANGIATAVSYNGTQGTLKITSANGSFHSNTLFSRYSSATGYLNNINMSLGVINESSTLISTNNNIIFGSDSGTTATVTRVSHGIGANAYFVNNFINVQTVSRNTDLVLNYLGVNINAADYQFPSGGAENANTIISNALTYVNADYGTINSIIITNNGTDYDTVPYIIVYEPVIARYNKKDFILDIANTSGNFKIGEIVTQSNVNMGIVKSASNTSVLYLNRITFTEMAIGVPVVGSDSGTSANVVNVSIDNNSMPIGLNAVLNANVAIASGSITVLDVVSSGTSYYDGEIVSFSPMDPNATDRVNGSAIVRLKNQGKSEGYYKENNSVTSGNKYLQDGDYYQEFSYEILSPITLDKYADLLKNILHIAGTKHFSKYVLTDILDTSTTIDDTTITIT